MNTSFSIRRLAGTTLAATLVGLVGANQAAAVTISATWDPSPLSGTATSGASTFSATATSVAAATSQTWDDVLDIGVTKTFSFSTPFSVTVTSAAPALENYFSGANTTVVFTGGGTVTALPFGIPAFAQSFTIENVAGPAAKMTYNGSAGTQAYTSVLGGTTYSWSAKFLPQASVTQSLSSGSTTYTWTSAAMEVTLLSAVPEPTTAMLLALGLAPLVIASRRRRRG